MLFLSCRGRFARNGNTPISPPLQPAKDKDFTRVLCCSSMAKKVVIMLEKRVPFGIALKQRENITDQQLSPAERML